MLHSDLPLVELTTITDVFAEDIDHVEILGGNARVVYWRWRMSDGDGRWQRVALEWAIVRPLTSFRRPLDQVPNLRVIRPPSRYAALN